jgi:hypothetical protein
MPCRPISSAGIAGSLVPARQVTCGVWLGPALAARVWVRSHLVCHWLAGLTKEVAVGREAVKHVAARRSGLLGAVD